MQTETWAAQTIDRIVKKLEQTAPTVGDRFFPYTTQDGVFVNEYDKALPDWWTNGFWTGILWKAYEVTQNELFRSYAESLEKKLDVVIQNFDTLHHDVGFMWLLSSVENYRITGNEESRKRGMLVAATLAGRFNPNGDFIRAWNGEGTEGWVIIDSMMNLPLLYWASREAKDIRFQSIATRHADTILKHALREDGSVKHIIEFDPVTGEYVKNHAGQGYDAESSWSRGQAWALYGFALSYRNTGKAAYLNAAKRVAHYFIAACGADPVPPCDFRSPKEPRYTDTTAGLIAACGLLELAGLVSEHEKEMYRSAGEAIVRATVERYCDFTDAEDSIVQCGTEAYHSGGKNIPIIYGDYYLFEALLRLDGSFQ